MTIFMVYVVCSLLTVILSQHTHAHARTCAQLDVYEHQFVTSSHQSQVMRAEMLPKRRICAVRNEV
jgi:hypothetical protein